MRALCRSLSVRLASNLVAILAVAFAAACGSSSPTTPPTPTPTPAPVMTLVNQGTSSNLLKNYDHWQPFTTVSTGRIDVTVDWTFTTDAVQVLVATGSHTCYNGTYADFTVCNVIASVNDSSKPKKLSLPGEPAGVYTLYVFNHGPNTEAIAWQVFVTTP
jgi:hypothetical protein